MITSEPALGPYRVTAEVPYAWAALITTRVSIYLSATRQLRWLAATGWAVNALIPRDDPEPPDPDEPVEKLFLHLHPSQRHGTPDQMACARAMRLLERMTGWEVEEGLPTVMFAPLALREGYRSTMILHPYSHAEQLLDGVAREPVWIYAVRVVADEFKIYQDPGVIVYPTAEQLPQVARAARGLGQQRFVVTDNLTGRTFEAQQHEENDL